MLKDSENISSASLKKLGVKRVTTDVYHVGAFKYLNLTDALAEAKRANDQKKAPNK
ncbi:hypothetical protein N8500_11140 [Candidatus Puniceispirillum sp.]|nr:hypothetical protein [Candidatus Puniceispirillum sp.]